LRRKRYTPCSKVLASELLLSLTIERTSEHAKRVPKHAKKTEIKLLRKRPLVVKRCCTELRKPNSNGEPLGDRDSAQPDMRTSHASSPAPVESALEHLMPAKSACTVTRCAEHSPGVPCQSFHGDTRCPIAACLAIVPTVRLRRLELAILRSAKVFESKKATWKFFCATRSKLVRWDDSSRLKSCSLIRRRRDPYCEHRHEFTSWNAYVRCAISCGGFRARHAAGTRSVWSSQRKAQG
jgi:hypothetical protein